MKRWIVVAAIAASAGLFPVHAEARPPQREQPSVLEAVFTEVEKRLIREYYAGHAHSVAADSLPPGMRKRLARGKPLPPGIAKRFLPGELEARLPVHSGTVRRVVGGDVVLVAVATDVILDILFDVIKH